MKNSNSTKLSALYVFFLLIAITIFSSSCRNERGDQDLPQTDTEAVDTVADIETEPKAYRGEISPLNLKFNDGEVSGSVAMRIELGVMRINVYAEGLEPNMMHLQHLQASEEKKTDCPGPDADRNNDGIIDVTEITDDPEGVKMIPLNMGPSSLEVDVPTYPYSNVNGVIQFETYVHIDSLRTAVRKQYGIENVDFTNFTYVIQSVSKDASIPGTTVTIGEIPPYKTVPIGCAVLEEEDVD